MLQRPGLAGFVGMSCAYGPYDAGKVIYAEVSGDESLKHRHIERAKGLYAKRILRGDLDDRDIDTLNAELGVAKVNGVRPKEADISWYDLLDWIEAND